MMAYIGYFSAFLTILGFYVIGKYRNKKFGWLISGAGSASWVVYALLISSYPVVLINVVLLGIDISNVVKMKELE